MRSCRDRASVQNTELEHNSIYAALFTHDPGNSWHWAIYLHHASQDSLGNLMSGYKLHSHNKHGPWIYECSSLNIVSTLTLVLLAKIGAIEDKDWGVEFLNEFLGPIPMEVPEVDRQREPTYSCRTWFREAIRVLHRAQFFIDCPDVDALERELSSQARLVDAKSTRYSNAPSSVLIVSKSSRPFSSAGS